MVQVKALPKELIFVLGGARSGKSAFAERLAALRQAQEGGRVLYVATAEALDADMERRIANHRRQRPPEWDTLEEPLNLASALSDALQGYDALPGHDAPPGYDTCLLDCLTLWVSNMLLSMEERPRPSIEHGAGANPPPEGEGVAVEQEILVSARRLMETYEKSPATWIVVSNEVGLGVVPPSRLGAVYRDALGRVNQLVAARADKVYFMAAGLALEMKSLGALPYAAVELPFDKPRIEE